MDSNDIWTGREQIAFPPRAPQLQQTAKLELWGGIECSVVRVGNYFRNQLEETGHSQRLGDLDAIAELGISTLRYPILWEMVAPEDPRRRDWRWYDERVARLNALGIRPIAGLVHHGSGPKYTSLLDDGFAEGLAEHARNVAERYPWIEYYTPVNEPLTTARFSGLYGHWYPHGRDEPTFLRALVSECRAVALAMEAIREVVPHAKLVQTEDLGKTFATPKLQYQADYENERRWLSFDLLCGRVDRHHRMYRPLRHAGITEEQLEFFHDHESCPDIMGINHYLTSERYLDHRVERYDPLLVGGNGRECYVDVEALRVRMPSGLLGPAPRLREAWDRYNMPIAITEAHNGALVEEQIRWLHHVWTDAQEVRDEGADIRAVTVWAMFGAVDWHTLLRERVGYYEPGPFDASGGAPVLTDLGRVVAALARSGKVEHPALQGHGWWRRPDRFLHK